MLDNSKKITLFCLAVFSGFFFGGFDVSFAQNSTTSTAFEVPTKAASSSISVTPQNLTVTAGTPATVRIQTNNVYKCTVTGEPYNNYEVIKSGNILLRPNKTTQYIFNCFNISNKIVATTKVNVTVVPVPQQAPTQFQTPQSGTSNSFRSIPSIPNVSSDNSGQQQSRNQAPQQS
jgi:hypothetical protein